MGKASQTASIPDGYDAPEFWDLAFSDETIPEADFIEAVLQKFGPTSLPDSRPKSSSPARILEIACGGGRQVIELAIRGHHVTAFDLNERCIEYVTQRLRRKKLDADLFIGDMTSFRVKEQFDLAHCLVNSFRHLISEADAVAHLNCVTSALKPGGLYLLGLHLLPPDAAEDDCERWTIHSGKTRVTTTIRVLDFNRRTRIETVRFSLKVTRPTGVLRFQADHRLRIYRADQMRSLLKKVPELELIGVYDFNYDLEEPRKLDDELGDTVLVLKKTGRVTSAVNF
ncbi:MAG: class I SAM-dependent methyltransferase [Planctomycetaceae bacterium]|nr:class I SAM-dependent methyltransferase [Planctomycetaceae bacterium]